MNMTISLAHIRIAFRSEFSLDLSEYFRRFIVEPGQADTLVDIIPYKKSSTCYSQLAGKDLLLTYYREKDKWQCEAYGKRGPIISVSYNTRCTDIVAGINEAAYPGTFQKIDKVFQLLPIRQLLLCHNAVLLHSSRVEYQGKGILFAGCSGVGKSTQAGLWRDIEGADILCNDRTLVRCGVNMSVGSRQEGPWMAFGYPIDGSTPVADNNPGGISAIVFLGQSSDNEIIRLGASKALSKLMCMAIIDAWNSEFYGNVAGLLADLVERIPIYHLNCRKDASAVQCLKLQLQKDGVL